MQPHLVLGLPEGVIQRVYGLAGGLGADELLYFRRDTDADSAIDDGFYALHDLNGTVVMLLDDQGAIKEKYSYSPYGTVRSVPSIAGDIDEDGIVTSLDYGLFLGSYGKVMGTDAAYDARADFDRDGLVSVLDFGIFIGNFGKSAPAVPAVPAVPAGAISAFGNTIGYAGYVWEPHLGGPGVGGAGMYQVRFRWYVPELGRLASRDPLGYTDALNLQEYVRGSPLILRDPLCLGIGQFLKDMGQMAGCMSRCLLSKYWDDVTGLFLPAPNPIDIEDGRIRPSVIGSVGLGTGGGIWIGGKFLEWDSYHGGPGPENARQRQVGRLLRSPAARKFVFRTTGVFTVGHFVYDMHFSRNNKRSACERECNNRLDCARRETSVW